MFRGGHGFESPRWSPHFFRFLLSRKIYWDDLQPQLKYDLFHIYTSKITFIDHLEVTITVINRLVVELPLLIGWLWILLSLIGCGKDYTSPVCVKYLHCPCWFFGVKDYMNWILTDRVVVKANLNDWLLVNSSPRLAGGQDYYYWYMTCKFAISLRILIEWC